MFTIVCCFFSFIDTFFASILSFIHYNLPVLLTPTFLTGYSFPLTVKTKSFNFTTTRDNSEIMLFRIKYTVFTVYFSCALYASIANLVTCNFSTKQHTGTFGGIFMVNQMCETNIHACRTEFI